MLPYLTSSMDVIDEKMNQLVSLNSVGLLFQMHTGINEYNQSDS